jgi:hypothetical protein
MCVRYLDALCDVVEHVDCLPGEGEIAATLPLILAQLPVPARLGLLMKKNKNKNIYFFSLPLTNHIYACISDYKGRLCPFGNIFTKTSFSIQSNTVIALGYANMLVLYAGLGREMAADYDHNGYSGHN